MKKEPTVAELKDLLLRWKKGTECILNNKPFREYSHLLAETDKVLEESNET